MTWRGAKSTDSAGRVEETLYKRVGVDACPLEFRVTIYPPFGRSTGTTKEAVVMEVRARVAARKKIDFDCILAIGASSLRETGSKFM